MASLSFLNFFFIRVKKVSMIILTIIPPDGDDNTVALSKS